MSDNKNPVITPILNPVNLDSKIEDIRLSLEGLTWLRYSFGRAFREVEQRDNTNFYYPAYYRGNRQYVDLLPNENLEAFSFMYVEDSHGYENYFPLMSDTTVINYKVRLIMWCKLTDIDNTKDYVFTELLKQDVRNVLKNNTSVNITQEFDKVENIYQDFTVNEVDNQFIKYPFAGFRLDFDLSFPLDCKTTQNIYTVNSIL